MNEKIKTMKDAIESAIQDGSVKMKSRAYFITRSAVLGFGLFILAAAIVYVISFGTFVMYIRGGGELLAFGVPGMYALIKSFPFVLLVLAIIFIVLFELLLKQQTISYRKPIIISVAVVVCASLLIGFGFAKLPVHEYLYSRAISDTPAPLIGPLYKSFGEAPLENVTPGIVVELTDDGFILETLEEELLEIRLLESTRMSRNQSLSVGVAVMVLGTEDDDRIEAYGVKIIPEEKPYAPFRKLPRGMHDRQGMPPLP